MQVWNAMGRVLIDRLRLSAVPPQDHWTGGKLASSQDGAALDGLSGIDGRVFTTIATGTHREIYHAVAAARQSYRKGVWWRVALAERKKKLLKPADLIETHALEIAMLGVRDNAAVIGMAYQAEPLSAAATFRYSAESADKICGEIAPTALAAELATSTVDGLASAVWTSNPGTARRMIRAVDAGVIHVNTYGGADLAVPLGGFKQSGHGC